MKVTSLMQETAGQRIRRSFGTPTRAAYRGGAASEGVLGGVINEYHRAA